ncbi:DUF262 domain-containing protein [Undibacterium sp.]|uniref:DUF262 domain-containing protein n=1 Tax=Undibacterium sp. TaxID=1914977 RepID=UPI0037500605
MNETVRNYSVRELLTDTNTYWVPMYQRNYAWGEGEIKQLLQDALDYQEKNKAEAQSKPYYIGTLVVFERKDGSFEVIDGQQRFTTLTLLAMCLKRLANKGTANGSISFNMDWYTKLNLDFESRANSSLTFASLFQGVALNHLQSSEYNLDVVNGFSLLEKGLIGLNEKLADFCDYLFHHVQIARVSVPKDTDLNHYFEVMNNRGEQLEKHEVVKARLMSVLNTIDDKITRDASIRVLSKVWDATANMERYAQYGFAPHERHKVFGENDWGRFTPTDFNELKSLVGSASVTEDGQSADVSRTLADILETPPPSASSSDTTSTPERFNSVINFSNFLLHVLRVWSGKDIPLDDKQLLDQFELHILKTETAIEKTQDFIFSLLKCKYLFDQFIIKREFSQGEDKWSLKRLHFYNAKSQSYINTFDRDEEDGFEGVNRRILMLLSAMHVSTPTLVYKHWLNGALNELYQMREIDASLYLVRLEQLARQFVYGRFLSIGVPADYYAMIYQRSAYEVINFAQAEVVARLKFGEIENNLVFNYLDYLLWREGIENDTADDVIKQFEFSFRSSVEHFYPQHPMDGHKELDQEYLHRFGNLCLISHSKNSRLSNFQPKAKRDHFKAAISDKKIDTLKLYNMIKLMDSEDGWGPDQIQKHEEQMLRLFKNDLQIGVHG